MSEIAPHGSPADRGSADAYYQRQCRPHKLNARREYIYDLTPEEEAEYRRAYKAETEIKQWF